MEKNKNIGMNNSRLNEREKSSSDLVISNWGWCGYILWNVLNQDAEHKNSSHKIISHMPTKTSVKSKY